MKTKSKIAPLFASIRRLLTRPKHARLLVIFLLAGMTMPAQAAEGDIYIVDTVEREAAKQLGEALAAMCASCGEIQYRQMNGNMRAARRIAEELSRKEENGSLSLVITLGKPATRVLADKLKTTTILYTFVGQEIAEYKGSEQVIGLPTDAPLLTQVSLLTKLLPTVRSAGILLGGGNSANLEGALGASDIAINVYRINDRNDLPDALRMAVKSNDALILLRDRMVVNNDTVQFVLQQTLENGRHTIAYSQSLVDMGFAAALVPKPEAFGRLIGQAVEGFFAHGKLLIGAAGEDDYLVHLNPTVMERLDRQGSSPRTASIGVKQ